MKVPFVDLRLQYENIKTEIDEAIQAVINDTAFVGGKYAGRFEEQFAEFCGAKFCVGVGNGTDALYVALRALGVGPGDEVITAANSFIATSEAITMTGAKVVFVDCDPLTYNISPDALERAINERTRAIVPVHLYGQMADMGKIIRLARESELYVVEDAAQAHGARLDGKPAGTAGHAACFSFYPGKNLGAYGDAGAIVTNDEALARECRMTANHGRIGKYDHEFEGVNSRLDGIQASILSAKLKHLHEWTRMRRAAAELYGRLLRKTAVEPPCEQDNARHVYHLYVVRVEARDQVKSFLAEHGIATGIHYPIALPLLKAYSHLGHTPDDFPVAYNNSKMILSLPMFPEITEEQVNYVCERLIAAAEMEEKSDG